MSSPIRRARSAVAGRIPTAGAVTAEHTPSSWTVEATGHERISPEGRLASRAATSRVKGTISSASSGPSPSHGSASPARRTVLTPCPS